jgi:transposase-like protein
MPRHYTPEDRDYALQRLVENRGNVVYTADELGISPRTLYKWRKRAKLSVPTLTTLPPIVPISPTPSTPAPLPTDDLQRLRNIKDQMLDAASTLSLAIEEAIAEATLGQRVTALVQITDRIVKLVAQLPTDSEEENTIRIEFIDEKGVVHDSLPESDEDCDE